MINWENDNQISLALLFGGHFPPDGLWTCLYHEEKSQGVILGTTEVDRSSKSKNINIMESYETTASLQSLFRVVLYYKLLFFCASGNGVVIHLPGLFEEAEKNERKGKSELKTYFT